jgi:hypothetical protein
MGYPSQLVPQWYSISRSESDRSTGKIRRVKLDGLADNLFMHEGQMTIVGFRAGDGNARVG